MVSQLPAEVVDYLREWALVHAPRTTEQWKQRALPSNCKQVSTCGH